MAAHRPPDEPRARHQPPAPDDDLAGLFGPGSVTWRLHADPVAGIAGLRALLLQPLDPLSMAGVDQHSRFRSDPWGRLARTVGYVATTTYGTVAEAHALARRVQGMHRRVRGTDPVTGRSYDATSGELLLWVHCCLVDSFASTAVRAGASVSGEDVDRYLAEQVRAAALIGIDPGQVPTTRADLDEYFRERRPLLRGTSLAREAVARIIVPPLPGRASLALPALPAWTGAAGLAFALLPGWARRAYGLPTLGLPTVTHASATLAVRTLRRGLVTTQRLVPALREPAPLAAARARLAQAAAEATTRSSV